MLRDLLNSPLFILVAFLFGGFGIELCRKVTGSIRSWFGTFSGDYIAFTGVPNEKAVIVEMVRCRQVQDKLTGETNGWSLISAKDSGLEITPLSGQFKFSGNEKDRVFVISYHAAERRELGTGTLTLQADSSGEVFGGVWAGFVSGVIVTSSCVWIRRLDVYSLWDRLKLGTRLPYLGDRNHFLNSFDVQSIVNRIINGPPVTNGDEMANVSHHPRAGARKMGMPLWFSIYQSKVIRK